MLKKMQNKETRKFKTIGGQGEVPIIVINIYWAMLQKSLKSEKWMKLQMLRMESAPKKTLLNAKKHF